MNLKAHRIDNIISAYKIGKAFCMKTEEEVYIKSEADKVFADKDKAFEHSQAVVLADIAIIKKQKRKRCLAMAKACREKSERMYCEASVAKAQNEIIGNEPKDAVVEKFELWGAIASTHCKRWLEIAEKFK
jgi:lipid II:glycine glycyltransferase (peptidoglycan interpeptide bridge formation enzyme)